MATAKTFQKVASRVVTPSLGKLRITLENNQVLFLTPQQLQTMSILGMSMPVVGASIPVRETLAADGTVSDKYVELDFD
jgi:hypothetical protein